MHIRTSIILSGIIFLTFGCSEAPNTTADQEAKAEPAVAATAEPEWTQDQADAKAKVEELLTAVGNADPDALEALVSDKANLGAAVIRDGVSTNSVMTIGEYFERARSRDPKPFYEPVNEYQILVNKGQIAFVWADAILCTYGVPKTNNIDVFTLIKEDGEWKFISIGYTNTRLPDELKKFDMELFAKSYAQVWSGVRPNFVSMFFEEDGVLQTNGGTPAEGSAQITQVVQDFMRDFPERVVRYDSLVATAKGTEMHWTLTATDTTNRKINLSGYELLQMGDNGLILTSERHFPTEQGDQTHSN
ncbi:ester cyclase [Cryomorphaceae bacterium 1068]|nr:ester cyclase [Cryomorphaceae bacterium 1068]